MGGGSGTAATGPAIAFDAGGDWIPACAGMTEVWYDWLVMKLTFVPSRDMSTMAAAAVSRLGIAAGRT